MTRLEIAEAQLRQFCRERHILRLSLFGSRLMGAARPDSDIDLLVEFEPCCEPGLIGLASMEAELAAMLGQKADLRTPQELSCQFRDRVRRTAAVRYTR